VQDFQKLYDVGDKVKVVVLNVDPDKKRVSLGLKASYFENDDDEEMSLDEDPNELVDEEGDVIETDSEPPDDDSMQIDSFVPTPIESQSVPLSVGPFNWTGETALDKLDPLPPESGSESEDDDGTTLKQKSKHKRSEIKYDKTLSHSHSSAADFERTLLSQPDASLVWTQYMAHLLQLGEVEKARAIAERALKTINLREEGEKFNIWVAFLNMENAFGTDESLENLFRRACDYTDKKKMHLHLVSMLIKAGKDDKALEMFETMIKKFSQSCKIWMNYAAYLMEHDREEDARELLTKCLRILPKRKRIIDCFDVFDCRCESNVKIRSVRVQVFIA
jgi:rRNA biogenesis protein RRP5